MSQRQDVIVMQGGMDLVSPGMSKAPGSVIAGLNYESEARGYRRCGGYERYSGLPAPSEATYTRQGFRLGSAAVLAGDVITGLTSGAMGTALVDGTLASGTYGDGTATGDLILHTVTGTFQASEALQRGGITIATADGLPSQNGGATDELHKSYIVAERARRRALIGGPGGSGPIRGAATYKGVLHVFQDDLGVGALWKATNTGWVKQTFGTYLAFDGGTTEFSEGTTVTGGTSGATGTVRREVLRSGAWDGSATGFLALSGVTGTFQNNEALTGGGGAAVVDGTASAIALPAAGTYRAIETNFYATASGTRLYFTTGTGRAFEWDGTTLVPIYTGLSDALDTPQHIAEHRLHLFLGYTKGSLMFSSIGTPLVFNATTGAGEIGFGQAITGLKSHTRDSLIVTGRNKIGYLTGTRLATFDLASVTEASGAIEDTLQIVASPIFLDDMGVRDLGATEAYGDWNLGTLSEAVEPLMAAKKAAGVSAIGSLRVRSKGQYRLFFADQTALVFYFGRKRPEALPLSLDFMPTCLCSGEDSAGREILFAGSLDGMVYRLDAGTSFDGEPIEAFLRLAFSHQGAPNVEKRYHRAKLEGEAGSMDTNLGLVAEFGYADPDNAPSQETAATLYGSGDFWDSAIWDAFDWSSPVQGTGWAELNGLGVNASVAFLSDTATETPHTLSTLTLFWSPRRAQR